MQQRGFNWHPIEKPGDLTPMRLSVEDGANTSMDIRMKNLSAVFLVVVLAGVVCRAAFAQSSQTSLPKTDPPKAEAPRLTIQVSGGDKDAAVENASVYLKYVEVHLVKDKKFELNVKTNHEGTAHIPDAPLGRVLVQVVADGWKTYGKWFEVTEPRQTIKIHLEKPPKWY